MWADDCEFRHPGPRVSYQPPPQLWWNSERCVSFSLTRGGTGLQHAVTALNYKNALTLAVGTASGQVNGAPLSEIRVGSGDG